MTVSDLIIRLQYIQNKYGDLQLIYATDEEGNQFEPVILDASVGYYNNENKEFVGATKKNKANAVCIN